MIVSEQMEESVEHQDPDLFLGGVSKGSGLGLRAVERDGEIAQGSRGGKRREAQDISGIVVPEEFAIEALQGGVSGEKTGKGTSGGDVLLEDARELMKRAAREPGPGGFK